MMQKIAFKQQQIYFNEIQIEDETNSCPTKPLFWHFCIQLTDLLQIRAQIN